MESCDLVGVGGHLELIDHGVHLGELLLGHSLCREGGRRREQEPAHLEHLLETLRLQQLDREHQARQQLAGSEARHVRAVASADVEHLDLGQGAHRLAQRPARHAESFSELVLGRQPITRAQLSRADHRPNVVDHTST